MICLFIYKDNDECLDNPCTQKCTNFKGGYRCECIRGYNDRGDKGIDCKAEGKFVKVQSLSPSPWHSSWPSTRAPPPSLK